MGKNLFLFTFVLLIAALAAQLSFTEYTPQEVIPFDETVVSFGYSPDQKHFIVLTGVTGQFVLHEGFRMENKVTVTVADDTTTVNLISFAFDAQNALLVVGSSQGSVYGFEIQNNKIVTPYTYKKNIGTEKDMMINSISISSALKIAVGARDTLFIFQIPADQQATEFAQVGKKPYNQTITSVVWKYNDDYNVLVGCIQAADGIFEQYNWQTNTNIPINLEKTLSIAVFHDGQVLQGKLQSDIQMFVWDDTNKIYTPTDVIAATTDCTELKVDAKGEYFGAVVVVNTEKTVKAWKIATQAQEVNLQNFKTILTVVPTPFYSDKGTTFALSGNGNELLILADVLNTLTRYALCLDTTYYDNDACVPCANNCQKCFNANTCLSCPVEWYLTVDNNCVSCSTVTFGCLLCSDANTCTECNVDQHWKKAVQGDVCACDDTYFESVDNKCLLCKDQAELTNCELCTDATHCTQCYPDGHINPIPPDNHCVCLDGWYFDDKNVCQDCTVAIKGCLNCDAVDKCTLCDAGNHFEADGNGKCQCAKGYWFDEQTTPSCVQCTKKVDGCTLCKQDGTCTGCAGEKRVPNQDGSACVCQPHTYQDEDNLCVDCDPYRQCLQCDTVAPHSCTKCDTTQNRKQDPVNGICQCQKGFIQDNHLCVACNIAGCQDCSEVNKCDKCLTNKHFKPDPQDNVCICQDNRHLTDNKTECWTCGDAMNACTQCDNLKECSQCDDGRNFELNGDKKCQCKASFFQQGTECKLCSEEFKFCQNCNSDNCESCYEGFSYNENQKKCYCPDDRDFDQNAGKCESKAGLSALAIIAIIVGILALAGGAVALIKCFKKRQSPLEDDEYEALEGEKDK